MSTQTGDWGRGQFYKIRNQLESTIYFRMDSASFEKSGYFKQNHLESFIFLFLRIAARIGLTP